LTKGLPPVDQRLAEVINRQRNAFLASKPNLVLGAQVFEKSCAGCHQSPTRGARSGRNSTASACAASTIARRCARPNRNVDQRSGDHVTLTTASSTRLLLREEGQCW